MSLQLVTILSFMLMKSFRIILIILACVIPVGCVTTKTVLLDSQQMEYKLRPSLALSKPACDVWPLILKDIETNSNYKILVNEEEHHLISYCESVDNWMDLGRSTVHLAPFIMKGNTNNELFAESIIPINKGTALTTIWIEKRNLGCTVHICRVYHSTDSYAGISHSIGDFERGLFGTLNSHFNEGQN